MEAPLDNFPRHDSLTRTVFAFVGPCRVMAVVDRLAASLRYLGWARFVRSSATLRSSPRVRVVVLRTMRVTMRLVPFSPRLDVFVDSIDEPASERASERCRSELRSRRRTVEPSNGFALDRTWQRIHLTIHAPTLKATLSDIYV